MFRKPVVVVLVLIFVMAVALPTTAAPRQQSSFERMFWSLVERFIPQFSSTPQKSDAEPGIDPDDEDKGSSIDPGGLVWPPSGPSSETTHQGAGQESGPGSDPDGRS